MKQEVFDQGMALLGKTWPDFKITRDTLEVYEMALGDLHESTFELAVGDCIRTCTFFPKPAEIRQRARVALERSGRLPPHGEVAWAEVLDKARHWNFISEVKFSGHQVADAVYAIGTIRRVAEAEGDELGFIRREFIDFYEQKREQALSWAGGAIALPLYPELPEAERLGHVHVQAGRAFGVVKGGKDDDEQQQ